MKYDLVIATTTCFSQYGHVPDAEYRRKLFIQYSESLSKTDWCGKKVFVAISNDSGLGWNQNYLNLLDSIKDIAPLCLIADSDAYFSPTWLRYLLAARYYSYCDAAGWQLYRSPRLADYLVQKFPERNFSEYRHASPHGLCFRTKDYEAPDRTEWFEAFIGTLREKHKSGFLVPEVSLIQHSGMYGLNNLPGASEDFDPNFPFNKECGIQNFLDARKNQEHNPHGGDSHAE